MGSVILRGRVRESYTGNNALLRPIGRDVNRNSKPRCHRKSVAGVSGTTDVHLLEIASTYDNLKRGIVPRFISFTYDQNAFRTLRHAAMYACDLRAFESMPCAVPLPPWR